MMARLIKLMSVNIEIEVKSALNIQEILFQT